jgi:putative ABC transport system ATP-binding protein
VTSAAEDVAPPATGVVRLQGVSKTYRTALETTPVLADIDLVLNRGEITCLAGPSGAGKSTIVSLIAGLLVPDSGAVLFNGQDVSRMSDRRRAHLRARRIGIVMQAGNLVPFLTAAENVQLAGRFAGFVPSKARVDALLEQVGLNGRGDHLPRRLSGGEAQRVALAVAMVNSPDVLLADEVVGQLDSVTARVIVETFEHACEERGLAVLLVTHSQDIAALGKRVLRLAEGRLESVA